MNLMWLALLLSCVKTTTAGISHKYWEAITTSSEIETTWVIRNMTAVVILDMDERIASLNHIKLNSIRSVAYEIGYTNYQIVEEYRKMIEKYNASVLLKEHIYPMELMIFLMETESHYWQIKHLVNMQHEVERKYRVKSHLKGVPDVMEITHPTVDPKYLTTRKLDREERKKEHYEQIFKDVSKGQTPATTKKKKPKRWWWPIEYGWEIDTEW